jgi:uncharacterized protein YtpQ (UPF0354 family)
MNGQSERSTILPRLKHFDWPGKDAVVCRRLIKSDHTKIPYVAFGYDRPDSIEFINRDHLPELGMTERELESLALKNLRVRAAEWDRREISLDEIGKMAMLICTGDYFSTEQILNKALMREASKLLYSPLLVVGIPRTGTMIATSGKQNMKKLLAFTLLTADLYGEPEAQPVTSIIFAVQDGVIIGPLSNPIYHTDDHTL